MIISELFEAPQLCPECGGISFSDLILAEKKDACYHKVKASAKVWPSAYASGRLVQCRKKGAANYGKSKNESVVEQSTAPSTGPWDPRLGKPGSEKQKRISATLKQDSTELAKWAKQQQADEIAAGRKINFLGIGDMLNKEDELRNQKAAAAKAPTSSQSVGLPSGNGTGDGAKSLTKKALGKVGRAVMPTLGFTDAAERLSNKDYTGAGISAAAGGIGLIPAWPAQLASGGLELVNMTRDEANALGGYDKLAKEISKNFTPATDPSYLPENPAQSEGVVSGAKAVYNRGKDFVKYLRRDSGITSQDIATQRNVGGKAIPSLGEPGKVVTSPTADKALTKLGGKNVETTPGPTVTVQKRGSEYEPLASDVPAYVRQGKPDPSTIPKPGSKPTIKIQPGETMIQAMQRAKDEQEFGNFLKGQGGQKFGTQPASQATSGPNQIPTIKLPNGQTIPDPYRVSPSGNYNTGHKSIDQIEYEDERAVDAMVKRAKQSVIDREARAKKQSDRIEPVQPKWKNRDTDQDLEEARKKRKEPEVDYDADYDAMVARVKKLAGLGPMKTVYNPARRVYKNVPTADQPQKK